MGLATFAVSSHSPAQDDSTLPPNWKAGGKSREGYFHEENKKRNKRIKRKMERPEDSEETEAAASEAQFEPFKLKSKRHAIALYGSSPELIRFDYLYSFSPHIAFILGLSGPLPIDVEVSMPSDIIKSDRSNTLAVAYPAFDINLKVDWGPYAHTGIVWHPLGGTWYTSFAAGVRSIKIKGSAATPLRVCTIAEAAKEPPCGNDQAAIQTRNIIALQTDISTLTTFARFTTGWIFNLSPSWAINAELGVFTPVRTVESSKFKASIVAPNGTTEYPPDALNELRAKSEIDLAGKTDAELSKATKAPLPVLALGLGFRF